MLGSCNVGRVEQFQPTKQVGAMLPLSQKNQKACTVYVVFAPCLGINGFFAELLLNNLFSYSRRLLKSTIKDNYSRALLDGTTPEH